MKIYRCYKFGRWVFDVFDCFLFLYFGWRGKHNTYFLVVITSEQSFSIEDENSLNNSLSSFESSILSGSLDDFSETLGACLDWMLCTVEFVDCAFPSISSCGSAFHFVSSWTILRSFLTAANSKIWSFKKFYV